MEEQKLNNGSQPALQQTNVMRRGLSEVEFTERERLLELQRSETTKEQLEQQLGYKIQDFKLEPLYDGKTCIGLSVQVVPVQSIKEITITGIISNDLE